MPGFVIDASATLPWCFAEEATPWTEGLLDRLQGGEGVRVPAHWPIEVMNGLIMAIRRRRIDLDRVARFTGDLAALPIRIEQPHEPAAWNAVVQVANQTQPYHLRRGISGAGPTYRTAAGHARWRSAKSGSGRRCGTRGGSMSRQLIVPSSEIALPALIERVRPLQEPNSSKLTLQ